MTVSVAGQVLPRRAILSPRGEAVLALIGSGRDWLDWASGDPRARYHFRDEPALLAGIQTGLHVSRLLLLDEIDLLLGIEKLMSLDDEDLTTIAAAAQGKGGVTVTSRLPDVLRRNGLFTLAQLAQGTALLGEIGVGTEPLFQCMGLHDRLSIMELIPASDGQSDTLRQQAAGFALAFSATCPEFADHYRAWLILAAAADPPWSTDAERDSAMRELQLALFPALDCPRVEPGATAADVSAAIEEWQLMGRRLGFARLSQGVLETIAHGGWLPQDVDRTEAIVQRYFTAAQAAVGQGKLELVGIGQDGSSSTFRRLSDSGEALVQLGADGIITLSSFVPPPRRAAATSTSSRRKSDGEP